MGKKNRLVSVTEVDPERESSTVETDADSEVVEKEVMEYHAAPVHHLSDIQYILAVLSVSVAVYLLIASTTPIPYQTTSPSTPGFRGGPYARVQAQRKSIPVKPATDGLPSSSTGWRSVSKSDWDTLASDRCNIVRKPSKEVNYKKFGREYRHLKPLIISFSEGSDGWTKSDLWSKKVLLKQYGDHEVGSGNSLDIVRFAGIGNYRSSMDHFLNEIMSQRGLANDSFLMCDGDIVKAFVSNLNPPNYLNTTAFPTARICLGGTGSGMAFHREADAWTGVVHGSQRWFLYDPVQTPPTGFWSGLGIVDWLLRIYPALGTASKPMECTIHAGEILYLPQSWYSGVVNVGDTVFVNFRSLVVSGHFTELLNQIDSIMSSSAGTDRSKFEQAFPLLMELHKMHPTNAEFVNRLGENYAGRADFDGAIKTTLEVLRLDPLFFVAHLNLGKMYFAIEQYDESEKHFRKAAEISPSNSDLCWMYGEFLVFRKRVDDGINWFKKGAKFHPDKADFFANLELQAHELVRRDPTFKDGARN